MSFPAAELMEGTFAHSRATPASGATCDEVSTLTWAIIDGVASDTDRERLASLLANERSLRKRYVHAVQLNCHLEEFVLNEKSQLGAA